MLDFGRLAGEAIGWTEDFLRRAVRSKAVREAERRQAERRAEQARARRRATMAEAGRRVMRAGAVTGASGAALIGYGAAVAPVGTAGLMAAGGATLVAATATLFWPTRPAPSTPADTPDPRDLPALTEEWLLEKRTLLPRRAEPAVDRILGTLADLHAPLARIDPAGPLAGDIARLAGGHLPRLVDSYLELPATTRERRPEAAESLVASLGIVADELARLCEEASRDKMLHFKTQGRFLETRYRDDGPV